MNTSDPFANLLILKLKKKKKSQGDTSLKLKSSREKTAKEKNSCLENQRQNIKVVL